MSSSYEKRDPLTGLFSRRTGHEILSNFVEHFSRVALLLCDVDRFKSLNECFGHMRGDEELCRIARDLERICAPYPVCRMGGDEFIIVLHEVSLQQARDVADKILASQPPQLVPAGGEAPFMSFSIGFALFPIQATSAEHLLHAADVALLKVKRGGRLPDGTPYTGRNRAMTWGDFLDEFPEQSARFLNPDFAATNPQI
ncbi:diguanylate cyclase DosC [Abditibacteriota bacterium]|nr:diguanylate cyclase DosC [Abditibacteriota bacterium]